MALRRPRKSWPITSANSAFDAMVEPMMETCFQKT